MKIIAPEDMPLEAWRPGVKTRMLVSAVNGAAQLCIFEQWVAPGVGARPCASGRGSADGARRRSRDVDRRAIASPYRRANR